MRSIKSTTPDAEKNLKAKVALAYLNAVERECEEGNFFGFIWD